MTVGRGAGVAARAGAAGDVRAATVVGRGAELGVRREEPETRGAESNPKEDEKSLSGELETVLSRSPPSPTARAESSGAAKRNAASTQNHFALIRVKAPPWSTDTILFVDAGRQPPTSSHAEEEPAPKEEPNTWTEITLDLRQGVEQVVG